MVDGIWMRWTGRVGQAGPCYVIAVIMMMVVLSARP